MNPAHEEAHVELLREAVASGDRTNGLRRFILMERALDAELGIAPGRRPPRCFNVWLGVRRYGPGGHST